MVLNLILIGILWVFILDYSGFVEELEGYLGVFVRSKAPVKIPKPFSCSLCMTWWTGLFYLIFTSQFSTISLLVLILSCSFTKVYLHLIYTLREFFDRLISLFDSMTGIE